MVIYPRQESGSTQYIDELQLLVIGNPLNEGRTRSAVLKGKVVDGKTGDPLPGAVVSEIRTGRATTSDQNGNFSIGFPTGDYTLTLAYVGFQPGIQKIRVIEDGYAEFEIFEKTHAIGEVTVTGEYRDLPRSQMSLVTMDGKTMKEIPALLGEVDLVRTLTMQQ